MSPRRAPEAPLPALGPSRKFGPHSPSQEAGEERAWAAHLQPYSTRCYMRFTRASPGLREKGIGKDLFDVEVGKVCDRKSELVSLRQGF